MPLEPSPKDLVFRDAASRVYRFRREGVGSPRQGGPMGGLPLLLVPSLINRWYVLDLRPGASLVESLTRAGLDVYCLDWGVPGDEDRYVGWDDVLMRLARAARFVLRDTGKIRLGLLGYCMGGTLAGIHAALQAGEIGALVNLLGPFDFSKGGRLREMVDPRWFDADAIADAGNVGATQMQSGFQALRPTLPLSKWVNLLDKADDAEWMRGFASLEEWGNDNVPFPAEAYRTYIRELYQGNRLISGEHFVRGRRASLKAIDCPVLTIVADADTICPPDAATALNDHVASQDKGVLRIPGGHVGAVVGSRASRELYPAVGAWLKARLGDAHAVC